MRRVSCYRALMLGGALLTLAAPATAAPRHLYVSDFDPGSVTHYDLNGAGLMSSPLSSPFTGDASIGIVMPADGQHLYVANPASGVVAGLSIAPSGALTRLPAAGFGTLSNASGAAVTPDGTKLYVTNYSAPGKIGGWSIGADGALTPLPGSPYATGRYPFGVTVSPDGRFLYAVNAVIDNSVSGFAIAGDGSLSPLAGSPVATDQNPVSVTMSQDGSLLFVATQAGTSVAAFTVSSAGALTSVAGGSIDLMGQGSGMTLDAAGHLFVSLTTNDEVAAFTVGAGGALTPVTGSPFPAAGFPKGLAAAAGRLYVATQEGGLRVSAIGAGGGLTELPGSPVTSVPKRRSDINSIVLRDSSSPVAALATPATGSPGADVAFDASASTDADGAITTYAWDFGDGSRLSNGGPTPTHAYAAAGTYTARVTLTDNGGCSTTTVPAGATAPCPGSAGATRTTAVTIVAPSVPAAPPGGPAAVTPGPPTTAAPPSGPAPLPLTCTGTKVRLVELGVRSGRVALLGIALPAYAGRTVTLRAYPGGVAGTATVQADGTFVARLALPPARVRRTVRYGASVAGATSARLALRRRFVVSTVSATARGVVLDAAVTGPRRRGVTVSISRDLTCKTRQLFRRVKLDASGHLRITLPRPAVGAGTAYYRATTTVLGTAPGKARYETFSLPIAVRAG